MNTYILWYFTSFLKFILISDFSYNDDNIWHVSIPEVSKEDVSCFIEALYLGSVPADRDFFKKFQTLSEMLLGISNEWWTAKDHHDTQWVHVQKKWEKIEI